MESCEICYWNDKCEGGEVCEDYMPLSTDTRSETEYRQDLSERAAIYKDIADQFGGK